MTISLSQVADWAALKPPLGLSRQALLAWRRFVPIELDGERIAFPAKMVLAWLKSTGAQSVTLDAGLVRGDTGRSRVTFRVYESSIPCEESYSPYSTSSGGGGAIRERCEWTAMVVDGKTSSTAGERKAANHAKKLDKAKREYAVVKKELDKRTKEANDAMAIVAQPLKRAIKEARTYLSVMRARRAYENDPTIFPSWMPETCERSHFDCETQASVTKTHKTREIHAAMLAELNAAIVDRDAYKPHKTRFGTPILGPKWDKLTGAIDGKRRNLLHFMESQFKEYVKANDWPDNLRFGWLVRPYSRARLLLKGWPALRDELTSKVTEARARLDKLEPGWQYWQKDDKASWVHESEADKLVKVRELGAVAELVA